MSWCSGKVHMGEWVGCVGSLECTQPYHPRLQPIITCIPASPATHWSPHCHSLVPSLPLTGPLAATHWSPHCHSLVRQAITKVAAVAGGMQQV